VAAKAATAEPPKTSVGDADQWKLASERKVSRSAHDDSSVAREPPSFMPDLPKASRADQAEPRAFAPAANDRRPSAFTAPAVKAEPRLFEAPAAKPLADARRRDVAADRYAMASSEPPIKPISGQEPSLSGGSETSQPPAGASLLPPARQSAPAEPPALLPASSSAAPSFSPASTSAAPMPVAQTAADDYRREPASPQYTSSEPRRVAAPSYSVPARRDDGKYEVQPNDTYWTISQKLYGTTAYFKALAHHNANMGTDEERLKPGELILAPLVAELEKAYPGLCPRASRREAQQSQGQNRTSAVALRGAARGGRTYTVVEGDTLFNIARYELGKASRWAEIYDLNRDVLGKDFNYLTPGTQLSLPEGQKTDVIAQPPSGSYRR
jgi:nucleoid-associated protein YgaU